MALDGFQDADHSEERESFVSDNERNTRLYI